MKAILIIDMPKNCDECHLCMKYTVGDEWIAHCQVYCEDITDLNIRHDNCPLKPMPQKEEKPKESGLNWDSAFNCGFVTGWNACISEISEGNDESI